MHAVDQDQNRGMTGLGALQCGQGRLAGGRRVLGNRFDTGGQLFDTGRHFGGRIRLRGAALSGFLHVPEGTLRTLVDIERQVLNLAHHHG